MYTICDNSRIIVSKSPDARNKIVTISGLTFNPRKFRSLIYVK